MVEGVAHGRFDDLGRLGGRELVLGLALELGLANENGKHRSRRAHHVFGRDLLRLLAAGQFAVGPEALIERLSQAVLVRAAFGRRDGVAVGERKTVLVGNPGNRPFDRSVAAFLFDAARKNILRDVRLAFDRARQVIAQSTGEMKNGFGGRLVLDQLRRTLPADFDAAEKDRLSSATS